VPLLARWLSPRQGSAAVGLLIHPALTDSRSVSLSLSISLSSARNARFCRTPDSMRADDDDDGCRGFLVLSNRGFIRCARASTMTIKTGFIIGNIVLCCVLSCAQGKCCWSGSAGVSGSDQEKRKNRVYRASVLYLCNAEHTCIHMRSYAFSSRVHHH